MNVVRRININWTIWDRFGDSATNASTGSTMENRVASLKPVTSLVYMFLIVYAVNLMRYLNWRVQVCLSNQNNRDHAPLLLNVCTGFYWSVCRCAECADLMSRMVWRVHASSQVRSRPPVFALIVHISHSWHTDTPVRCNDCFVCRCRWTMRESNKTRQS